jgi:hypothetical protein
VKRAEGVGGVVDEEDAAFRGVEAEERAGAVDELLADLLAGSCIVLLLTRRLDGPACGPMVSSRMRPA